MKKILIAPDKYVQGPGVINDIGQLVKSLGDNALVTGGKTALGLTQKAITESFDANGIKSTFGPFGGEACTGEINRLKEIASRSEANVVVGVGGGKSIDTTKAVGYYLRLPVVIVPTIAATDAPCSALSVIYTDHGVFESYLVLPKNPNLVLVDTEIIARSPVRLFVSGMGDALATWFEADACRQSSAKNMPGGYSTATAINLARLCYDIILEYGYAAKLAVEKGVATQAVEKVVEANTLLSGLGFESSGLAAAHAVHDGLTVLEETHSKYHGEKVSFGTITQLVMENRPMNEMEEVLSFCASIGLPVTLEEINVTEVTREKIMKVAEASCQPGGIIHNMPIPVTPDLVYNAILGADAIGTAFLKKMGASTNL
ncbi:MAG: glycerol dehydrogenase [Desulfocucumaceae bacterium]